MTGNDILQIPRRTEVPNGAAMVGIKHGPDLLAVYSAGGRLMYIFDSVREVDIIVEDPLSDQPVTSADLSSARTVNFDDCELDGTTTYFIGGDTGAIKIGRSVNAAVRLKDIQACSPIPVRLLATRRGGSREKLYHKLFAAHRLHNEWFSRHPDILAEIDRLSPSTARRA
ncbi:MAG TPA: GIY-YIG nuclease family protein [Rhizorhapis sp.]